VEVTVSAWYLKVSPVKFSKFPPSLREMETYTEDETLADADGGVAHTTLVVLSSCVTDTVGEGMALKTQTSPATSGMSVPVIVTRVEPGTGPTVGANDVITGVA
jgi:hypothetical protein